jgi:hypothetical protein
MSSQRPFLIIIFRFFHLSIGSCILFWSKAKILIEGVYEKGTFSAEKSPFWAEKSAFSSKSRLRKDDFSAEKVPFQHQYFLLGIGLSSLSSLHIVCISVILSVTHTHIQYLADYICPGVHIRGYGSTQKRGDEWVQFPGCKGGAPPAIKTLYPVWCRTLKLDIFLMVGSVASSLLPGWRERHKTTWNDIGELCVQDKYCRSILENFWQKYKNVNCSLSGNKKMFFIRKLSILSIYPCKGTAVLTFLRKWNIKNQTECTQNSF